MRLFIAMRDILVVAGLLLCVFLTGSPVPRPLARRGAMRRSQQQALKDAARARERLELWEERRTNGEAFTPKSLEARRTLSFQLMDAELDAATDGKEAMATLIAHHERMLDTPVQAGCIVTTVRSLLPGNHPARSTSAGR